MGLNGSARSPRCSMDVPRRRSSCSPASGPVSAHVAKASPARHTSSARLSGRWRSAGCSYSLSAGRSIRSGRPTSSTTTACTSPSAPSFFAANRTLLTLAAGAIAASFVFIITFDPFANWNLDDYSYRGINTADGFARNLFLDGFHPVLPWVAFYLFGMWLGRTDLRDPVWRRTLAIRAAIVVVLTEAAAWIVLGAKGSGFGALDHESWRWLFSVEPIPPLPLYLAAGAGTAVLVIIGSIWIGDHVSTRLTEPLVSTGQLALTIYVAHVLVGMGVLEEMGRLDDQTLGWAVWTSVLFSAAAILFSWLWRRRFARGPLEELMRRAAG